MQRFKTALLLKNSIQKSTLRFYSVEVTDAKSAKLQVLKERRDKDLKKKIEDKLKAQKQREEKRKAEREEKEQVKAKTQEIKKMAQEKEKENKVKLTQLVKRKLDQQKRSQWVKKQKEKEKEEWQTLKNKLKNKGKRAKDPKAPTRPRNAFLWYFTKNFQEIKSSMTTPVKSVGDVTKEGIKRFNSLSEDQKKPYLLLAQEDQARYGTERKKYVATKKSKRKPQTSYIRFFIEIQPKLRQENPTAKVTEIAKMIAGKWNALSQEEKKKYQDAFEKEKLAMGQHSQPNEDDSE